MTQRIIYQTSDGGVAIITPSQEALSLYGIYAIAEKDVPPNKPFKIVSTSDIPTDRTFRDAWTVDPSALTDGVGSVYNTFRSHQ